MTAIGKTLNLNGKWGASVTLEHNDDREYYETRYDHPSEEAARLCAEYSAWVLWMRVVEWE